MSELFTSSWRAREIERRYRCIDARHAGHLHNPVAAKTWCLCGRVQRRGDHAVWPSTYERAEASAHRQDDVGTWARTYLTWVHAGRPDPAPTADTRRGPRTVAALMGEEPDDH